MDIRYILQHHVNVLSYSKKKWNAHLTMVHAFQTRIFYFDFPLALLFNDEYCTDPWSKDCRMGSGPAEIPIYIEVFDSSSIFGRKGGGALHVEFRADFYWDAKSEIISIINLVFFECFRQLHGNMLYK